MADPVELELNPSFAHMIISLTRKVVRWKVNRYFNNEIFEFISFLLGLKLKRESFRFNGIYDEFIDFIRSNYETAVLSVSIICLL